MRIAGSEPDPPRGAERLLGRLLSARDREWVLGDLHEEHSRIAAERGRARAAWWYRGQVAGAVVPVLKRRTARWRARAARRLWPGERTRAYHRSAAMSFSGSGQEMRLALRALRRSPAHVLLVVATLGLAVGGAAATFAVVDGVLLRPLPYQGADRIVSVSELHAERLPQPGWSSVPNVLDWRARAESFETIALFRGRSMALTGEGDALHVYGTLVSPDFFAAFGTAPALGRGLVAGDDLAGAEPVVVLSHGLWLRRFGGEVSAIGGRVVVSGVTRTVVGVMPRGFSAPAEWIDPGLAVDLWVPFVIDVAQQPRDSRSYSAIGRLRPEVGLAEADGEMQAIAAALRGSYPQANEDWQLRLVPWREMVVGSTRRVLLLLFGAMGLLLLVAGANTGNLVLNRWLARRGELGVRAALGAGRARLVRGVLLEAVLLGAASGVLGLGLARGLLGAVRVLNPGDLPRLAEVTLDARVVVVTLATALLAGLLAAIVPALFAAASSPEAASRVRSQGGTAAAPLRARHALAVAQLAVALALLIGSTLALRGFAHLRAVRPGFEPEGVLTATVALAFDRVPAIERRAAFVTQVLERLTSLPGAHSAAMINSLPFSGSHAQQTFAVAGADAPPDADAFAGLRGISPRYAETMRIAVRGRELTAADLRIPPAVALVNESLARRYLVGRDPLGTRLLLQNGQLEVEVVGVLGDVRHFSLDQPARPEIYLPYTADFLTSKTFVVRTVADPYTLLDPVRRAILEVDPEQPLRAIGGREALSMSDLVHASLAGVRFQTFVLLLLAGLATAVSALGLFAVLSQLVMERRREIGIRMAVGAERRRVLVWILGRTARLALTAAVLGVAVALFAGRALEALLFDVSARDPLVFASALAGFLLVALAASAAPALRATRLDPARVLRE